VPTRLDFSPVKLKCKASTKVSFLCVTFLLAAYRRSLAGGLCRHAPDLWLTGDHFVDSVRYGTGQSTKATQPSIHPGSANE